MISLSANLSALIKLVAWHRQLITLIPHAVHSLSLYRIVTRSENNISKPKQIFDHLANFTPTITPTSAKQVQTHPDWREVMKHKLDALMKNQIWKTCSAWPDEKYCILQADFKDQKECRWVHWQIQSTLACKRLHSEEGHWFPRNIQSDRQAYHSLHHPLCGTSLQMIPLSTWCQQCFPLRWSGQGGVHGITSGVR